RRRLAIVVQPRDRGPARGGVRSRAVRGLAGRLAARVRGAALGRGTPRAAARARVDQPGAELSVRRRCAVRALLWLEPGQVRQSRRAQPGAGAGAVVAAPGGGRHAIATGRIAGLFSGASLALVTRQGACDGCGGETATAMRQPKPRSKPTASAAASSNASAKPDCSRPGELHERWMSKTLSHEGTVDGIASAP